MQNDASPPDSPPLSRPRPRIRLSPEIRRQQILDAALLEFSAVGFEGATMDKIALRVGLTKAGLYAHFPSKDEIFDALLLSTVFRQPPQPQWEWREGASLENTIDRYLDAVYPSLRDKRVQAVFRLLIGESGRDSQRIRRWRDEIFMPYTIQRQRELDLCVDKGLVADNAMSRMFSLASAPALLAMVGQLLTGQDASEEELAEIRAAHREMLLIMFSRKGA